MCQQQFLEVYLEGTRSRSGKPSTARAGMLSIVVDVLRSGSVADVLVVPVGISYDRIIEGNYNSEQLVSYHASPHHPPPRKTKKRSSLPHLNPSRGSRRRTRAGGE